MPQEWKPPSYATPLQSSSDTWKPPSYAIGGPKKEEKKSFFSSIADDLASFLESHPKLREGLQSGLTGTSPELEQLKRERAIKGLEGDTSPDLHEKIFPGSRERELARLREGGNVQTVGTPESEGSILPRIKQPETFTGGFLNSLYEDYIRPLGTPSGALGSSMPEHPLVSASANIAQNAEGTGQKLLEAGPRFISGTKGIQDVETGLPIRQSREIPYRPEDSYTPKARLYDPEAEYANYLKMRAAEEHESGAALRGTPEDIPSNPAAQRLEALRTTGREPMPIRQSNTSVQDIMKPESLSMMDKMHAEANPVFARMQAEGLFSRGAPGSESLVRQPRVPFNRIPFEEAEGTKALSNENPSFGQRLLSEEGSAKIIEDKKPLPPSKGPAGPAVDKLLNNIQQSKGIRTKQEGIYKQERARRFAAYEGVNTTGMQGSIERLGKLKGEYDKINRTALDMSPEETGSLFDAIKKSYLTTPEKIRAEVALHKIFEGGGVPQRNELKLLDDVFSDGFAEKFIEMHGGLGATGIKLGKTANTMKSMMSSTDLSGPLRQGIGLVHKKEWQDASKEMFNFLKNKEYYDASMKALHERPMHLPSREAGLFLAKPDNLLSGEEAFMNSYVHLMPGVRDVVGASERAYTGFLNKLRADTFDNLVKNAEAAGHKVFDVVDGRRVPTQIARNLAKFVNNATGRGSLRSLEKFGPELNNILWSPRLISSRLTVLNPKYYMDLDPFTRKEAIKSLLAIAAASTTMNTIASLAGAKVGYNILSSDFLKSRFGDNKVLDPNAGFQQPIVATARMIAEANRMRTGGKKQFGQPNIPEIAGRFAVNKLSPAAGLAYDVATAKAFTGGGKYNDRFGNKKSIQGETLKRFVPIFTQDMQQLLSSDPSFAESVGLGGAALFGAGVQDYPERTPNAPLRRKMSLSF